MNWTKKDKADEMDSSIRPRPWLPLIAACILSAASLVWTAYSLTDFLGVGLIGLTVAIGADLVWSVILWADYKGMEVSGKHKAISASGWIAVLAIAGILSWHGFSKDSVPMAVVGVLPPIGAKIAWTVTLYFMKDPTALTVEQQANVNDLMRESAYAALQSDAERKKALQKHEDEMAQMEMESEKTLAEEALKWDLQALREQKRHQILISREEMRDKLEMSRPLTIRGETVERQSIESGTRAREADTEAESPDGILVPVTGLTEAQQKRKRLVALWIAARDDAHSRGEEISQAQFCRRMKEQPPTLSKALRAFPPESLTQQDVIEAIDRAHAS